MSSSWLSSISGPAGRGLIPIRRAKVGTDSINGSRSRPCGTWETLLGLNFEDDTRLDAGARRVHRTPGRRSERGLNTTVSSRSSACRHVSSGTPAPATSTTAASTTSVSTAATSRSRTENRGKVDWGQRIEFPFGTTLTTELAYVLNNDRNFYEQWCENDYDTGKDKETQATLSHTYDNRRRRSWCETASQQHL